MRILLAFTMMTFATLVQASTVSQTASHSLNQSKLVLLQLTNSWDSPMIKRELMERIQTNAPLINILSEEEFSGAEINGNLDFISFSARILEEQKALIYIAKNLSSIAELEGLKYEHLFERRKALSSEWTDQMSNAQLSVAAVKGMVDRILYFSLNEKYKEKYATQRTAI